MTTSLCAACALAAAGAGCGSSSGSSSGKTSGSSSKSPILIGTEAPIGTATLDYGSIPVALQAAANGINKAGGINGHPLKVWSCNTEDQANQEIACARQAVSAGVIAMIGANVDLEGPAYERILTAAHIADIENTGASQSGFQGTNTFPITWEIGSFMPCASSLMQKATGTTKVVNVTFNQEPATAFTPLEAHSAKASGLAFQSIETPVSVSDFSPFVAQASQTGTKAVLLQQEGAGPQAFVRAASEAGATYAICTALGLSGTGGWAGLGSATKNLYVGATFAPLSEASKLPELQELISEFAAIKATGNKYADTSPVKFQAQAMGAWLGTQAFAQVAKTMSGTITAASFLQAIGHAKVTFGGIIPNINFATPQSAGPFQRVFNSQTFLWKWNPTTSSYTNVGNIPNTIKLALG